MSETDSKFVRKGCFVKGFELTSSDMDLINSLALEPLSSSQVYTFEVIACDNDIDRDYERFDEKALADMASLMVGRTMIKDHSARADNQVARIYAAEVADGMGTTSDGLPLKQLVVRCYMLDNEANRPLIDEIKAGIKREVSVSFMPGSVVCSICGTDRRERWCDHFWGQSYDGELCYFTFSSIEDAYELSFVAIPAQRNAGTRKDYLADPPDEQEEKECDPEVPVAGGGESDAAECDAGEAELDMKLRMADAYMELTAKE